YRPSCLISAPPISHPPTTPLFPYTTLFRSEASWGAMLLIPRLARWSDGASSNVLTLVTPTLFVRERGMLPVCPASTIVLPKVIRSEEHTSELQSLRHLVCRLLLEKKNPRLT